MNIKFYADIQLPSLHVACHYVLLIRSLANQTTSLSTHQITTIQYERPCIFFIFLLVVLRLCYTPDTNKSIKSKIHSTLMGTVTNTYLYYVKVV